MTVLRCAEADWSDTPPARAVARFLDARVAAGERAADDLEGLSPGCSRSSTRFSPRPANRRERRSSRGRPARRRGTLSTRSSASRRIVDPVEHAPGTIVGSRAIAVDTIVAALSAEPPRSVLLVGEPGAEKTTLIVEARRLDGWLAFQATAADVIAGQVYIGMLEGRMQDIVTRLAHRPVVWIFPELRGGARSAAHAEPARCSRRAPSLRRVGRGGVVGEIDPLAYELIIRHRPRVARLFEVVRLTPIVEADALAVARDWAEHNELEVDDETLAEALDLASHYLPATAPPGSLVRLLELVRDGSRAASPPR